MTIASGVPTFADLDRVLSGETFRRMEADSRHFLEGQEGPLSYYRRRWTADPLHTWSRRWEYPYVHEALREAMSGPGVLLDAGAGATFFPFHVAHATPGTTVHAVDSDKRMGQVYDAVGDPSVVFTSTDITALDFPAAFFDGAYSVSVLEHIRDRSRVASEVARVLKPGGPLVLTIDISIDGREDINIPDAEDLIQELGRWFDPVDAPPLRQGLSDPDILVTTRLDPADLPWNWSLAARTYRLLRHGKSPFRPPTPALTVYGSVWRRNHEQVG